MTSKPETMLGLAATLGAFCIWGLTPIYFRLLDSVRPDEIIAHRVVWSVVFLGALLVFRHRSGTLGHVAVERRVLLALAISGLLIATNWLVFVFAVNSDRILSTSLGYFINPLVSVIFGMMFFRETLNPLQTVAVVIAAAGTLYMTLQVGQFPWIALALAVSFALYGVVRKMTEVGPMVGLFWETLLASPLALAWLWILSDRGQLGFSGGTGMLTWLLVGTGLVTLVPLVLFAAGVRRLPLSTVGILQYVAPSMTFCLAVFIFNEPFTMDHAITFGCVWLALILFSWSGWVRYRRTRIPV